MLLSKNHAQINKVEVSHSLRLNSNSSTADSRIHFQYLGNEQYLAKRSLLGGKQRTNPLCGLKSREPGKILTAITFYIGAINDMNSQIDTAAGVQTVVVEEINQNVVNVQIATKQTSFSKLELAKLVEELKDN
jgi:methyl-accepting chemotaxis protein